MFGRLLVVMARDEVEARERLRHEPWYAYDILSLVWVKRWRIFMGKWEAASGTWRTRHMPIGSSDNRPLATFAGVSRAAEEVP